MQNNAFSWGEPNAKMPLLPADLMSLNRKAGTFRLGNLNRFELRAHLSNRLRRIVSWLARYGDYSGIVDAHHFHLIEIDQRKNPFNGVGVAVISGTAHSDPAERPCEPPGLLLWCSVVACTPRINHDHAHVRNASFSQGRLKRWIILEQLFCLEELIEHNGRLDTGDMTPGRDFACCNINDSFVCCPISVVKQFDERFTLDRITCFEVEHDFLWRFMK